MIEKIIIINAHGDVPFTESFFTSAPINQWDLEDKKNGARGRRDGVSDYINNCLCGVNTAVTTRPN